jgi:peptidoglycan/LPS O-acetylase OafA/YrhL
LSSLWQRLIKPGKRSAHPLLGDPPRKGYTQLFSGSFHQLIHPPPNQIAFLDGLRTIAILLVVNHHFSAGFASMHGDNFYSNLPFVINGWSGVDLFFVLSGFFIGGQLWKELQKDGTISIRRFIVRRGLRIWPLFFFIFASVFVIYWPDAATKQYGWTDLVFLTNYLNHGIVGGGWSLCTEEQFYIVTPLLLCLFARKKKLHTVRLWLWGLVILIPIMRAIIWVHHTGHFFSHDPALFSTIYYKFHTHCDGLVVGLIISNLWISYNKPKSSLWKASLLVVVGFITLVILREVQHEIFIFTGLALFFGSLVWFGLTSRVMLFQSRLFYWISRLSFGMYLNHGYLVGPIVNHLLPRFRFLLPSSIASQLLGTLIITIVSAIIAIATFCLVEHPFLSLRTLLLEPHTESQPVRSSAS